MVRMSLVDDEANVRAAAAKAFDVLQEQMGAKAIDETIPTLLEALRQPGKGSGTALQALREAHVVNGAGPSNGYSPSPSTHLPSVVTTNGTADATHYSP